MLESAFFIPNVSVKLSMFPKAWSLSGLRGGGLGRTLVPWSNPERFVLDQRRSRQDRVESTISFSPERVSETLPELVKNITRPLYEVFGFYSPSLELITEELARMRRSRVIRT